MTTNHTPGPWIALPEECDKPYIRIRGTVLGGRYKIANVVTPVYEGAGELEAEETRANAALIAAALGQLAERDRLKAVNAELLAALVLADCMIPQLVRQLPHGVPLSFSEAHDRIKAAIAKARKA